MTGESLLINSTQSPNENYEESIDGNENDSTHEINSGQSTSANDVESNIEAPAASVPRNEQDWTNSPSSSVDQSSVDMEYDPLDEDIEDDCEDDTDSKQAGSKDIKAFLLQKMHDDFDGWYLSFYFSPLSNF